MSGTIQGAMRPRNDGAMEGSRRALQVTDESAEKVRMASDAEDDWAPLSPEQLCQQPGACEPPAPKSSRIPLRRAAGPNPDGERLLRELQHRIAATGGGSSLVGAIDRRERREQRRRARSSSVQQELRDLLMRGTEPPTPAPQLDLAASDMDVRETETWFLALPTAERDRLRAEWHSERHRYDGLPVARRRRRLRGAGYGALVFLVMGVLSSLLLGGFGRLPVLVAIGGLAGLVAECLGGGRMRYAAAGGLGFVVALGPAVFSTPLLLWNVVLAGYGMGVMGMDGEMRRSAGYAHE